MRGQLLNYVNGIIITYMLITLDAQQNVVNFCPYILTTTYKNAKKRKVKRTINQIASSLTRFLISGKG